MNSSIIYKVTHKVSGRVYVGATQGDLETRKKDHSQKGAKFIGHQFQAAVGTYGPEAFCWEQIDTANSIEELAKKEKQYIFIYDSKDNGYNSDSGGGFKKPVYQYSAIDGSLLEQFDCLESAANKVNGFGKSISAACLGEVKSYKGFHWSYSLTVPFVLSDDLRRKRVGQYDINGELLNTYISISEASISTHVGKSCIAKCCRGERKSAGGFFWEFE